MATYPATMLAPPLRTGLRPTAGRLTTLVAIAVSGATLAGAVAATSPPLLLAGAGVVSVCAAFVLRPLWGLMLILVMRPLLDLWSNTQLANVSGLRALNAGALTSIVALTVLVAFAVEQWRVVRDAPSVRPLVVFLALATVSVATGPLHQAGIPEVSRYATTIALYLCAYAVVRTRRDAVQLVGAVLLSTVPVIVAALYQVQYTHITPSRGGFQRVHATFAAVDSFGIFMALICTAAVPLLLCRRFGWRWAIALAAPFAVFAFIESYARTGWIATVVALCIIAAIRSRKLLLLLPVLLVGLLVAVPSVGARFGDLNRNTSYGSGNTLSGRIGLWKENLPTVERNPVTGRGFGYIAARPGGHPVHNDYVRAIVEVGIPGLAVYLWLIWATWSASWRWLRRALGSPSDLERALGVALFTVVPVWYLMSFTSNLMAQVVVAGVFWSLVATGHALLRRAQQEVAGYA
jgi:O-antigen ligase